VDGRAESAAGFGAAVCALSGDDMPKIAIEAKLAIMGANRIEMAPCFGGRET
jgi:hypothetical protein